MNSLTFRAILYVTFVLELGMI